MTGQYQTPRSLKEQRRLMRVGVFHVFEWRFMLTPLTVSILVVENATHVVRWGELYVFGVRFVRWKLAAP